MRRGEAGTYAGCAKYARYSQYREMRI